MGQGAELADIALSLKGDQQRVACLNVAVNQQEVTGRRHAVHVVGEGEPGGRVSRRLFGAAASAAGACQPCQEPFYDHEPTGSEKRHRITGGRDLRQAGLAPVQDDGVGGEHAIVVQGGSQLVQPFAEGEGVFAEKDVQHGARPQNSTGGAAIKRAVFLAGGVSVGSAGPMSSHQMGNRCRKLTSPKVRGTIAA